MDGPDLKPDIRKALEAKTRELGLWLLEVPEELGGQDLSLLGMTVITEELARTVALPARGPGIFGPEVRSILLSLSDSQKKRYLDPVLKGEKATAFAQTEPDAGADPGGMRTTAVREGDHYRINRQASSPLGTDGGRNRENSRGLRRLPGEDRGDGEHPDFARDHRPPRLRRDGAVGAPGELVVAPLLAVEVREREAEDVADRDLRVSGDVGDGRGGRRRPGRDRPDDEEGDAFVIQTGGELAIDAPQRRARAPRARGRGRQRDAGGPRPDQRRQPRTDRRRARRPGARRRARERQPLRARLRRRKPHRPRTHRAPSTAATRGPTGPLRGRGQSPYLPVCRTVVPRILGCARNNPSPRVSLWRVANNVGTPNEDNP